MKTLSLLTILLLSACSHLTKNQPPRIEEPFEPFISQKTAPTGDRYFIYIFDSVKAANFIDHTQLEALTDSLKKILSEKGFQEAPNATKAHLFIGIDFKEYVLSGNRKHLTEVLKAINTHNPALEKPGSSVGVRYQLEQENKIIYEQNYEWRTSVTDHFVIGAYSQNYRSRPKTYFSTSFLIDRKTSKNDQHWVDALKQQIAKLDLKQEVQSKKKDGDPGCYPMYGLETRRIVNEFGEIKYIISKLRPNSPATKSGLRIGDTLIAIDSQPFSDSDPADHEAYEKFLVAPIKYARNGVTLRSTIKPYLACDER